MINKLFGATFDGQPWECCAAQSTRKTTTGRIRRLDVNATLILPTVPVNGVGNPHAKIVTMPYQKMANERAAL
jgi:hypothetical protein